MSNEKHARSGCAGTSAIYSKFCVQHFSGSEERRLHAACFQPKTAEQVCTFDKVSPCKHVQSSRLSSTTRLAGKAGPPQCLFSHPSQCRTSKIPEGNISTSTVADDLPSVRPVNGAKDLCVSYQLDSTGSQVSRYQSHRVFRRFSSCMPESNITSKTSKFDDNAPSRPGLDDQLREIEPDSPTVHGVPGSSVEPLEQPEVLTIRQDSKHYAKMPRHVSRQIRFTEADAIFTRPMQFRQLHCPERSTEQQAFVDILQPASPYEPEDEGKVAYDVVSRNRMVDQSRKYTLSGASPVTTVLPDDRCFCPRLGSSTQQHKVSGPLVPAGVPAALQPSRNDGSKEGNNNSEAVTDELVTNDHVRQSNSCVISTQRGRYEVTENDVYDVPGIACVGSPSDSYDSAIHSGPIQHRGRSALKVPRTVGVASTLLGDRTDIQGMGNSSNRPLRIEQSPRSSSICDTRSSGSECHIRRCIQSEVEVPVGVDFSPTLSNPASACSPQRRTGFVPISSPELGESLLAQRSEEPIPGPSNGDMRPTNPVSRCSDSEATNRCQANSFGSLADTGWAPMLNAWDEKQKSLLASGWRKSSLATYKPAWLRWCRWCIANNVARNNPAPQDLARFLTDLFLVDNLSHSTVCLHKSVVSTFCPVQSGPPLSSHIVVRQALKAIALNKPKVRKCNIWNVKDLCTYLENNEPCVSSLYEVSKRCAVLLLLCSGRRVHDLTLLHINEPNCTIESDYIIFWPEFGSKTDSASRRQSGWKLMKCDSNQNIDPVYWIKMLISVSRNRRGNMHNLFISTCGIAKPASRTIIGGWIKATLKDANIDGSAGSVRSAVASSSWLDNHNIEDILEKGNWQSANTFHRFYKKAVSGSNSTLNPLEKCFKSI